MVVTGEAFGIRAREGLHLAGPRLWLDGETRRGLAFVPAWDGRQRRPGRVLCSQTLAELTSSGRVMPLAIPYGKPFQLGRLTVELLPAGGSPGAALLRAHLDGRSLLFAQAARTPPLPTAAPVQWREADVLVLDATGAAQAGLDPEGLRQAAEAAILRLQTGPGLVWLVESPTLALEILAAVGARVGVAVAPSLQALARRYHRAGVALPAARTAGRKPSGQPGLVIWPLADVAKLPDPWATLPRWLLATEPEGPAAAAVRAERSFAMAPRAFGAELEALAVQSGAPEIVLYGAGAAGLGARLEARGLRCWWLQADAQLQLV